MAEMKMKALASTQKDLIHAMGNAIDELYCENKKTVVDPLTEAQLAGVIADLANAFEKTI